MQFYEPPEHGVEIMVDLETMGTDPYSPIIAIGAVRFEGGNFKPMPPFYQAIKLESCLKVGLRLQGHTVLWWMKQSDQARQVFEDPEAVDLPVALDAFTAWLGARPDNLWGNSAAFDLGLLKDAYRACGMEVPWAFYREKCYRTLKGLPGMDSHKLQRSGTHHNALDDAISQAGHAASMLTALSRPAYPSAHVKLPAEGLTSLQAPVLPLGSGPALETGESHVDSENGWGDLP
jgi:DNA polymerase III epsilon subunit-like protein